MPFTLFATPRHRAPYELRAQCGLLREWCCSNTPSPTQEATDGYCLCHARSRQSEPEETAAAAGDYRCGPGGGSPLAATQARPGADRDPARVATALVQRIAGPGAGAGRIPGEHRGADAGATAAAAGAARATLGVAGRAGDRHRRRP